MRICARNLQIFLVHLGRTQLFQSPRNLYCNCYCEPFESEVIMLRIICIIDRTRILCARIFFSLREPGALIILKETCIKIQQEEGAFFDWLDAEYQAEEAKRRQREALWALSAPLP